MSRSNNDRLEWIDATKGFCIICVVLYHVTLGLNDADILPTGYGLDFFWTFITAIATPPFFILSGYFISNSIQKHGYSRFFQNSFLFIFFPYVLWSVVQVTVKIVFSGYVNKIPDFNLINTLLLEPTGQFWFLHALFIAQIAFLGIHRFYPRNYFLLFVLTALISIYFYKYQILSQDLRGLSLLLLGAFASSTQAHMNFKGHIWMALLVVIFIFSIFLYNYYLVPFGMQSASNFMGGIAATIFLVNIFQTQGAPRILIFFGKHSMYIFLLHLLALVPFRILLLKLGISSAPIFISFLTLSGLYIPILFAAVIEPFGLSTYFGIKAVNCAKIWDRKVL